MLNKVIIPLLNVRGDASHKSELVNQLLFGEYFKIHINQGDWIKIESITDDYIGWIENRPDTFSLEPIGLKTALISSFLAEIKCNNSLVKIPIGSSFDPNLCELVSGKYCMPIGLLAAVDIVDYQLLNSPYLWGGRTGFGIDCSGLSQLLYRFVGIDLPRDAALQCKAGADLFFGQQRKGDLLFFENYSKNIVHVGIVIDDQTILHASNFVRLDRYDLKGIFNENLKKYTHTLSCAKRFIEPE